MCMKNDRLDHLVLAVRSIADTAAFYERVMGMQAVTFGPGRVALAFGQQKINLHQAGREITSVYFRDPDQNLIEVSNYVDGGSHT